jgi:hypothetical protein
MNNVMQHGRSTTGFRWTPETVAYVAMGYVCSTAFVVVCDRMLWE